MARRRASMREGPLAELFSATEAAQKHAEQSGEPEQPQLPEDAATAAPAVQEEPDERTVEHVPTLEEEAGVETPPPPTPTRSRRRCPIRSRRLRRRTRSAAAASAA